MAVKMPIHSPTHNVFLVLTMNGLVDCRMQLIFLSRVKLVQMSMAAAADWSVPPGVSQPS